MRTVDMTTARSVDIVVCLNVCHTRCLSWNMMILARQSEILLTTSNSNRYEPHLIFLQAVLLCVLGRPVLARVDNSCHDDARSFDIVVHWYVWSMSVVGPGR